MRFTRWALQNCFWNSSFQSVSTSLNSDYDCIDRVGNHDRASHRRKGMGIRLLNRIIEEARRNPNIIHLHVLLYKSFRFIQFSGISMVLIIWAVSVSESLLYKVPSGVVNKFLYKINCSSPYVVVLWVIFVCTYKTNEWQWITFTYAYYGSYLRVSRKIYTFYRNLFVR